MFNIYATDYAPVDPITPPCDIVPIFIGYKGENKARCLVFDLTECVNTFGDGGFVISFIRQGDELPYLVTNTDRLDNNAIWIINSTDTAVDGYGMVQLQYIVDDVICKSALYRTVTFDSNGITGDVPDPYQDLLAQIAAYAAAAEGAATTATAAANTATTAVENGIVTERSQRIAADNDLQQQITNLMGLAGAPVMANTAAAMTDSSKIYVYTGSEAGYVFGNWYYFNGAEWASGGVYQASAVQTDPTLTVEGMAADAAACGDLKSQIDYAVGEHDIPTNVSNTTFFEKLAGVSTSAGVTGIALTALSSYDTYYYAVTKSTDFYFSSNTFTDYVAFCYGTNYTGKTTNYLNCSNADRKRSTENNLPTSASPITVPAGGVIAITTLANKTIDIYGLETDYNLSDDAKAEIIALVTAGNTFKYVGSSGDDNSTERIEVFIPSNGKFFKYDLLHCVDNSINSNIWRMGRVNLLDANKTNPIQVTTSGEWEFACRLPDRSDFSGGILHGSEVQTEYNLILDGVPVTASTYTSETAFKTLEFIQKSTLYDPDDEVTVIGYHYSNHKFDENGLTLEQSTMWTYAGSIDTFYLGMLPASQSIFSKYVANNEYTLNDLQNKTIFNADSLSMYGSNKISVNIKVDAETLNRFLVATNSGTLYYKFYAVSNVSQAVANTFVKSVVNYSFNVG